MPQIQQKNVNLKKVFLSSLRHFQNIYTFLANEQEKQLERMRWTVKYAYELAELDAPQKDFVLNAEEIQSAKNQILKMTDDLKSRVRSHQSPNERDSLIKRLDVIVDFLLKITIHPIHPIKNECRNLLKLVRFYGLKFYLRLDTRFRPSF